MSTKYPITDTLDNIFHIIQGHQITDEEIYNSEGSIPIYTGPNDLKGYWDKSIITAEKLPCLSYATKAFDGTITLQNEIFDANNTAVIFLKNDYKNIANIEWFKYILPNKFSEIMTSKEGVSYLNKDIVKKIAVSIPDKDDQKKQIRLYKRILGSIQILEQIRNQYLSLASKEVTFHYKKYQALQAGIAECLDYLSGTSELTEEKIYQKQNNIGKNYIVLSGSTNTVCFPEVILTSNESLPRFENKEGLLVVRKGKAGLTRHLPPASYTLNDDAYILFVKDSCRYNINLKWLSIQYRSEFLSYASNSDNGTWNMTGFFKHTKIDIPSLDEQLTVVKQYEKLDNRISSINELIIKLTNLQNKNVIA